MKTGRRRGAGRPMAWLATVAVCVLAGHAPAQGRGTAERETLVARSNNQTIGAIPSSFSNPDMSSPIFVPVILTASGQNDSFFTSELTLTNRGGEEATLHYTYTAHRGGGSGTATDSLAPGRQRIASDAIGYLTNLGIPIPSSGNRLGTLRVEVSGSSNVGVSVRTTTSVPEGRAGLAYPGIATAVGFEEAVYLCGLRQNSQDRSNVAFQNMGPPEDGPITLRATVFSGDPEISEGHVLEERILVPGGFHQYNGILNLAGFDNGYVKVERVSGIAPFYAYGVINDQANSDGSFVFPLTAGSLMGTRGQTLPVIVETGEFTSELTVTNFSEEARTLLFSFVADGLTTSDRTAPFNLTIGAGQQRIIPDVIDSELRRKGVEGVSSSRGGLAGALFARVASGDMGGIVIGARTSSSDGRGGHYGVFYHAAPEGTAFVEEAWAEGLQQDGANRSNLALVNTGEVDPSPSVFQLDIYDGATGTLANTVTGLTVRARGWRQINAVLAEYVPGATQGYVRISKVSGNNPFLAYGVINDGGAPGQRTGDGAYLPATVTIHDAGSEGMTDREVLEVLYHATGGPDWRNSTNWLSVAPLSEWFGVETDGSGRVTSLNLGGNELRGRIPTELADLTNLQELNLAFNELSGAIPNNLQQLSELTTLDIRATDICVPNDAAFRAWLGAISTFFSSGLVCDGTRRVSFSAESYEVKEGETVTVAVRLIDQTGDPVRSVEIALTAMPGSGATAADYSGVPESVTITAPATEAGFVFTAVKDDPFDDGETVVLGFRRPLPSGVTAGSPETATVTIIDPGTEAMKDREVLEAFFHATGGPEWNNRTNWLSDLPLSEWFGVETDGDGRVTSLSLRDNRLSRTIPPELGALANLQQLWLSENQLSGAIPPELGEMANLQSLSLGDNQLSGTIPPELGELANLQSLFLGYNQLSGAIPPELGGLANLQWLSLGDNQLSGTIPPELGELANLQSLFLGYNQLSGAIPPELGGLANLQWLSLWGNQLRGAIPPELGEMANLQSLSLGDNQLSGAIPPELGELANLQSLSLWGNQLRGAIPPELGEMANLQSLDLGGNQLSGTIPPELGGLANLQSLSLWGNRLRGAIPNTLQQLSELTTLDLRDTEVCVPADVAFQAWLATLSEFRSSGIVCDGTRRVLFSASNYAVREGGSVTVSVRLIDRSEVADWSGRVSLTAMPGGGATVADYSGVPESITIMAQPAEASFVVTAVKDESFDAGETVVLGFRRPLPSGVTAGDPDTTTVTIIDPGTEAMTDREVLEALYHATGGPDWSNRTNWLSNAPLREWNGVETDGSGRVTGLYLGRNELSGAIPPGLGQLSHLQVLDLPRNQLSGAIPPELGQLSHLQVLELTVNQLTGTIPPELGKLTNLLQLRLGGNRLSGAIPPELSGLTNLQELYLVFNQLTGTIPPELGQLTHLQQLYLGANRLSGAIPPELGQLTQLQVLELTINRLSGAIPPELGGLTRLQRLWLDINRLSGAIPPEFSGLTQLQELTLFANGLSGAIPPELGQLTQLQVLNLRINELSGAIPPELGRLNNLQKLHLGSNQVSGAIPLELNQMTSLKELNFSFNQDLTGTIPPGLQQLPLSNLDLMATSVCVPGDVELQEWLATIEFISSGVTCGRAAAAMSSIDIAVFYTPAARRIAGGTAGMEAAIDLMIAETNQTYVDSGVNQRLVLVARQEVEYTESSVHAQKDLDRLASATDGHMDRVHAIRDQAGADLVHLIADPTGAGGIARLPGAFSLSCASCTSQVFAHELGHNMGISHDRYLDSGTGRFPYSYGYVNQQAFSDGAPRSARWVTIMAYARQCAAAGFGCKVIPRFSNPNQTYRGDPLGVPGDERTRAVDGPADAVRTLNLTRHSVSGFRPRASGNQLTMSSTLSQARSLLRISQAAVPAPGGSLFRAIAPNVRGAVSHRSGSVLDRATLRRREVSVDIGRLAHAADGESTALRLNLFDDLVLTGIIERWTPTYSGGYALSGRLVGLAEGTVTLVTNGSVVAGTVRLPGATYRIRPAGAGRHAIMQVDTSLLPQGCETVSPRPGGER